MKIKFIGTASGRTSLSRFHSSFIFMDENYILLADAGDGVSKALLNSGIDFNSVSSILFSHLHPDHSAGFPGLLVQMKMLKRTEKLTVYCHKDMKQNLLSLLINTHMPPERLDFPLEFLEYRERETFTAGNIQIMPALNRHLESIKSAGYTAASCAFLFKADGKNIFYSADVGDEDDLYLFSDVLPDIFISEAAHISVDKISQAADTLDACRVYLTHIDDDENPLPDNLPENFTAVEDGFEIDLGA